MNQQAASEAVVAARAPRHGLRQKLVNATVVLLATVGVTILLVVGLIEVFVAGRSIDSLESEIEKTLVARGQSLASSHADVFRAFVRDTALTEMQHTIALSLERNDVVYGLFTDQEGKPWAYCSPKNPCDAADGMGQLVVVDAQAVAQALKLPFPLLPNTQRSMRELHLFGGNVIEFAEPVRVDGELAGMLRYGVSTAELELAMAEARQQRRTLSLVALASTSAVVIAALLTAIWFARRIAHRITSPLYELTRAAEHLAHGDQTTSVEISSEDELEVLGNTFNRMVSELRVSYTALEENNRALAREIEERRQAQAERSELQNHLIQSQKMEAFGQLAGGVAHDFNNILAIIVGNSELLADLLDESHAQKDLKQLNAMISEAADRGANLTRQLLTFARRETDNPTVVDVNAVLNTFEKLIRRIVEENISLNVNKAPDAPRVYADPGRVEQVLMNLCVNARDAMPSGGTLTLRTKRCVLQKNLSTTTGMAPRGNYLLIEAEDTGTGIPQEVLSRVFEPFFTTKAAGHGTGLGLATVHGIVRSAGGCIDIETKLGEGTIFRIYLPAYVGEHEEKVEVGRGIIPDGGGHRVLLCEDDETVRDMTEHMLRRGGFEVVSVASPREALSKAQQGPIDLLVTDVIMPDMDGAQLAARLHETMPHLPVLFVSGYTAGVLAAQKLNEDSINFLRKPFRASELLERLHVLLQQQKR